MLETAGYKKFKVNFKVYVNKIILKNRFRLLSIDFYDEKKDEIDEFYSMLNRGE